MLTVKECYFLDQFPKNGFTKQLIKDFIKKDGMSIDLSFVSANNYIFDTVLVRDIKIFFKRKCNFNNVLDDIVSYLNYDVWFTPSVQPYKNIALVRRYAYKLGLLSEYRSYDAWRYEDFYRKEIEKRIKVLRRNKDWNSVVDRQISL